jgi:nifR3 family TIM-barrel protein
MRMELGFWKKLKKPFFCLAPMADVTDGAFRSIITKYGKPDVTWTEFTSADGLTHKEGKKALMMNLIFSKKEKPIVAQLFSGNPVAMKNAAKMVAKMGFDGIDINMGCPERKIEKSGAGACLIKTPEIAKQIILSAKEGVRLAGKKIPVSVKTRIGYAKDELDTWLKALLETEPAVITVHARTRNEMSLVPARWDMVKKAVQIRNELKSETLIVGNGDVKDLKDGMEKAKESGADGVMLGRAIFGNPWLFNKRKKFPISPKEKLEVLKEHTLLFEKMFKGRKNFAIMKKHFKAYCSGFDGAKELRIELMNCDSAKEVADLIKAGIKNLKLK